ncbi:hypothetical protein INT43_006337 [Umbelopsis isabellina]|uniref:Methyltransferase type 11 domain-containing protein n=1 Tax=Mortierella isabellina TaxID=91625 RepID=A0A8H7PZU4_MORIS|nr:hypothetical protein INT43_006337 [Umbelopsis isabellina]
MGNANSQPKRHCPAENHRKRHLFSTRHIPKYLKPSKSNDDQLARQAQKDNDAKDRIVKFAHRPHQHPESQNEYTTSMPNMFANNDSDDSGNDGQFSANFKWIKGRRFKDTKGADYLFPVDKPELDRQRMQAYVLKWAFGRSVLSPIEEMLSVGCKILDIGCGVGAWAIDIALDFPNTEVLGIDICDVFLLNQSSISRSPYSSSYASLHTDNSSINQKSSVSYHTPNLRGSSDVGNVSFEECNVLEGILYPSEYFDYIHQAHMLFAYTRTQWVNVLHEATRVLMPGGYIELLEVEFPGRRYGPKSKAIADKSLLRVSEKGFDSNLAMNLKELLRCAGLTEIVSTYISMPVGDWNMSDNYIGNLWRENSEIFVESAKPWLSTELGMTSREYSQLWKEAHDEMNETKAFINVWVAWGRKPIDGHLQTCWDTCSVPGWPQST